MAKCVKIVRKDKRVCVGSLNRPILLHTRSITPPTGSSVDFGEDFPDPVSVWAMIETPDGAEIFDNTNTVQSITHDVYIRYMPNITFQDWIELPSIDISDNVKLRILKVENINEQNRFYRLRCNIRGSVNNQVNFA